jgi:uncharacterized membrane protein YgcG
MWTKSTKFSKLNEQLQQDVLIQLEPLQQELKLSDEVATALIRHRIIDNQRAKAKISPQLVPQPVLLDRVADTIAGIVTQAKALPSQISTDRPAVSQKTAGLVLAVVGMGAIAIAISIIPQKTQPPTKLEASFSTLKMQPLEKSTYSFLIDQMLQQHFQQMDQQYLSTFDPKTINKLWLNTRNVIPTTLPKNDPITQLSSQKIDAKAKSHRDEWNRNEKHLAQSKQLQNQTKLKDAEDELKKIKLLGATVKKGSPYWNKKIQPAMDAIANTRNILNSPRSAPSTGGNYSRGESYPAGEDHSGSGNSGGGYSGGGNSSGRDYSRGSTGSGSSRQEHSPSSKPEELPATEWNNR